MDKKYCDDCVFACELRAGDRAYGEGLFSLVVDQYYNTYVRKDEALVYDINSIENKYGYMQVDKEMDDNLYVTLFLPEGKKVYRQWVGEEELKRDYFPANVKVVELKKKESELSA